jgi:hypothetical protein
MGVSRQTAPIDDELIINQICNFWRKSPQKRMAAFSNNFSPFLQIIILVMSHRRQKMDFEDSESGGWIPGLGENKPRPRKFSTKRSALFTRGAIAEPQLYYWPVHLNDKNVSSREGTPSLSR